MDWIQSLLFNDASVAHTVILYAFVIAVGVALGKLKFFGVSLGVTFVLFVGLIAGHFGFSAEKNILHFVQEFGLILFIYSIGLQVGPSFFSSFKRGGLTLNMLAVGIVVLNIAVALGIYFLNEDQVSMPMMVLCFQFPSLSRYIQPPGSSACFCPGNVPTPIPNSEANGFAVGFRRIPLPNSIPRSKL